MARIGLFGGSFNPVHNGHVYAARCFIRLLALDRLIVMPASTPPHKQLSSDAPSKELRLSMLRSAMADVPGAEVSDFEICRGGKSYTYDTLKHLRDAYPGDEIYLLMGTDMLLSFESWYRFEDLLSIAKLGVAMRHDLSRKDREAVESAALSLKERYNADVTLFDNEALELSSTTVRRMFFFGCGDSYVPDAVSATIRENMLYGCGGDYKNLSFPKLMERSLLLHNEDRRAHAVGCSQTAQDLARIYGENQDDAARAGILHDVTKALPPQQQLRLCEHYGVPIGDYQPDQYKLLHGKTAAAVAERIFGENTAVCSAISWHTTGKTNMTLLEKILYIADYIEPNRRFYGVEEMRRLAYSDLDAAVLLGIETTIDLLKRSGRSLNRFSLEARKDLRSERKST